MTTMDAETEREKTERSTQTYAALGVGFVCIIIGVPLWWKTTEVYRVQLPYEEITAQAHNQVKYYVDFTLVIYNDAIGEEELATFGENLKQKLNEIDNKNNILQGGYRGHIRRQSEEEAELFQKHTDLNVLDEALSVTQTSPDHGQVQFLLIKQLSDINRPWIGRKRNVFMPISEDLDSLIPDIVGTLKEILVNEAMLHKVFNTAKGVVLTKADKKLMRSVKSHPGYDVTFTLLNPEPQVLAVDWKIQAAIKEYMDPMLKMFSPFAEITVKSQCLHYTDLGVKPAKDTNSDGFRLNQDQLPHIINPIEAYLNSHVSTNPNLNFVLYVTPRNHHPLKIYDKTGKLSAMNSFLSPRWGGVMVYNVPSPENVTLPAAVELDMQSIMEVFLSQLRMLLAISSQKTELDVTVGQAGRAVITEWEMDRWLRLRTLENIATATSTLRSLAQLLEEISNIVIKDDIGREVERAVKSINKAQSYLYQSKLKEAFVSARQALLSSEKAFFDPSLLELLYFPEDQKFAIYIPLFLPISIPVLLSVIQSFKRISRKNKMKTE